MEFSNGDKVYIGNRYIGVWIGENPVTGSHVVYRENFNEYGAYHASQISTYPSVLVKNSPKLIK
jgi:hypothetical protein